MTSAMERERPSRVIEDDMPEGSYARS